MKFAVIGFVTVVVGCSGEQPSMYATAPTPSVFAPIPAPRPSELTFVAVVVIEEHGDGSCVQGATVEVVAGQSAGKSVRQADKYSYWVRIISYNLPA